MDDLTKLRALPVGWLRPGHRDLAVEGPMEIEPPEYVEQLDRPEGPVLPLHAHVSRHEVAIVFTGRGRLRLGDLAVPYATTKSVHLTLSNN